MKMKTNLLLAACLLSTSAFAGAASHPSQGWRGTDAPWHHQQVRALELAKKWDDLSPEEKKKVREAKERYRNLPEDKQQKLREKWEKMPKDERDKYKLERRYR